MARKHLIAAVAALGILGGSGAALAEYPVIDLTAIKQAIEQLKALKEQIGNQLEEIIQLKTMVGLLNDAKGFLNDITGFMNELTDSIGQIATIDLPIPNLEKISAQTKGDLRCLMPDGAQWGIKFSDLNLGSICDASATYRAALFLDPKATAGLSYADQAQLRSQIEKRRDALLEDTASRALAQADVQLQQADELNKAADSLQSDLKGAKTVQDRLHVAAQIQLAQLRGQARQTQILAQMLKLQGAVAVQSGLGADKVNEIEKGAAP